MEFLPAELFQILKEDAVKVLLSNISANLENSTVATGLERSVFIPIPKKGNAKEGSTTAQLHSSHKLVK